MITKTNLKAFLINKRNRLKLHSAIKLAKVSPVSVKVKNRHNKPFLGVYCDEGVLEVYTRSNQDVTNMIKQVLLEIKSEMRG